MPTVSGKKINKLQMQHSVNYLLVRILSVFGSAPLPAAKKRERPTKVN